MEFVFTYRTNLGRFDIEVIIPVLPNQPMPRGLDVMPIYDFFSDLLLNFAKDENYENTDPKTLAQLLYKKSKANQAIAVNGISLTITVGNGGEITFMFNRSDLIYGNN